MNKKQKLIMVVDDEMEIRNIINDILVEEGYKSIVASSANEARQLLIKHTPDLVFLDIWMPDEDGITLLKEWAEDQSKQFPVIMISGHATIETAIKATKLGAADFIEKPISIENLFGVIDKVFSEQKQEEDIDILSYITKNSTKFSDIFRDAIVDVVKTDTVFLVGEDGTEKRYIPSKCGLRNRANCEETSGCSWHIDQLGRNLQIPPHCDITSNWVERVDLDNSIVHFQKKC